MGLRINREDFEGATINAETEEAVIYGEGTIWMGYGHRANLAYTERGAYHSSPHHHTAEQLNFLLEGRLWLFVEDEAFLLGPGDFHRVPPEAVHWVEVEEPPVRMMEAHSPPLVIPGEEGRVGLFGPDEADEPPEVSHNVRVEGEEAAAYLAAEEEMKARHRESRD